MIIITGGAGFIGSAIAWRLNDLGRSDVLIVDELGTGEKWKNLRALDFQDFIQKDVFLDLVLEDNIDIEIEAVIHMGANSSTTEKDADHLIENNYQYSQVLSEFCIRKNIRFIYASSAATYGDGSLGFEDENEMCYDLRPLNMYGYSKNLFDRWQLKQDFLKRSVGLKYFNVFGPNEYHKEDMRSVVHKAFGQIVESGSVKLFKSQNPEYPDGGQKRDFIYVKDVVDMTLHFLENRDAAGLFNIGTGNARSWNDLVTAIFKALDKEVHIEYIDMPEYLAPKYQYFTEADITKLRTAGYTNELYSLEEGVADYVKEYLLCEKHLGDE